MGENLHEGHRQRVRARFLAEGLDAFEDHQVLELLLFFSIPLRDTNKLAHQLIGDFGSLANVLEADPRELCRRHGVKENTAVLLALVPQLARRYFKGKWGGKPELNSSSKAGEYVVSLFVGRCYEAFYVVCLDAQNRVNYAALLQEGTINEAAVYPRLVVEAALRHQANCVILTHNHPGGTLRPSDADIQVTKKIAAALNTIAVHVADHIIVAGEGYYSFAEHGLI